MMSSSEWERTCSELRNLTNRLRIEEPEEIWALRSGALRSKAGSYGQFFTTWDLANGILRDYSMNLYKQLRMAASDEFPVDTVLAMLRTWDPIYSEYLGDSGFHTLARYAEQIRESKVSDRDTLVALMSALTGYVNRLTAWSHHYFPWYLGERFPYEDTVAEPVATLFAIEPVGRTHPIRLRWEPLGHSVEADLFVADNDQLCANFLEALPFTVLQDHAVVTGESMYAWTPLVDLAPTPVTERICDAPIGRLRFSHSTGNKLVVQYGATTERLSVPVLGQVHSDDLATLSEVGRVVWESTFRNKEHVWLTVECTE